MKEWLTIEETANKLHKSERYVFNHLKAGDFIRKKGARKRGTGRPPTLINTLSVCRYLCNECGVYAGRDLLIETINKKMAERAVLRMSFRDVTGISIDDIALEVNEAVLDDFIERTVEYWDIKEVAIYLGVSVATVRSYIRKGWIKRAKTENRKALYNHLEVIELYWRLHEKITVENIEDPVVRERQYKEMATLILSSPLGRNALSEVLREFR